MKTPTRVKICCIADRREAALAVAHGAAAVGLVSTMPTGPGPIPEARIAEIAATVPPAVSTFLLTSLTDVDAIVAQQRRCRSDVLQLCRPLTSGEMARLRLELPGIALVPVVHVTGIEAIDHAMAAARHADAVLLDTGCPERGVLGGTGRTHDWTISRAIRDQAGVPVFLAGGLDPDNVVGAIHTVRPFGVDLCSGVRTDGALDEAKLARFFAAVNAA